MGSIGATMSFFVRCLQSKRKKKQQQESLEEARLEAFYKLENVRRASIVYPRNSGQVQKPTGTLLTDVTIDEVYLWEVEHLSNHFPSEAPASLVNHMHGTRYDSAPLPADSPTFIRALNGVGATDNNFEDAPDLRKSTKTHYTTLIGVNECVLADIVRKPGSGSVSQSKAFIRAGPRRELHFNPQTVNAAIVTCGGLCPGLNNVYVKCIFLLDLMRFVLFVLFIFLTLLLFFHRIREVTNSLIFMYGIKGKVWVSLFNFV